MDSNSHTDFSMSSFASQDSSLLEEDGKEEEDDDEEEEESYIDYSSIQERSVKEPFEGPSKWASPRRSMNIQGVSNPCGSGSYTIDNISQNKNNVDESLPIGRRESPVDLSFYEIARKVILRQDTYRKGRKGSFVDLIGTKYDPRKEEVRRNGSPVDPRMIHGYVRNEPWGQTFHVASPRVETGPKEHGDGYQQDTSLRRAGSAVDPLYGYSSHWPDAITSLPRQRQHETTHPKSTPVDPGPGFVMSRAEMFAVPATYRSLSSKSHESFSGIFDEPNRVPFASGRTTPMVRRSTPALERSTPGLDGSMFSSGRISPWWGQGRNMTGLSSRRYRAQPNLHRRNGSRNNMAKNNPKSGTNNKRNTDSSDNPVMLLSTPTSTQSTDDRPRSSTPTVTKRHRNALYDNVKPTINTFRTINKKHKSSIKR